jgi:hypothetical protein
MPAITRITAALMVLLDSALDTFATAQWADSNSACGINVMDVTLTSCGLSFLDALSELTTTLTRSISTMLLGFSVF